MPSQVISRFVAALVCAVVCDLVSANCFNIDNASDPCRYPVGDSWCAVNGRGNIYAYEDNCIKGRKPIAPVESASFDCAKAKTSVERMICDTPDIRAQDGTMGTLYRQVKARGYALTPTQNEWLRKRNACPTPTCLRGLYAERIRLFETRLNPPEPTVVTPPVIPPAAETPAAPLPEPKPEPAPVASTKSNDTLPPPVVQPPESVITWDCNGSTTTVERIICNTPDLHALNEKMEGLYLVVPAFDPSVSQTQKREWLSQTRDQCQTAPCLRQVYAERIRDLEAKLAPPPTVAAPAPAIDSPTSPPVARDVTPDLAPLAPPIPDEALQPPKKVEPPPVVQPAGASLDNKTLLILLLVVLGGALCTLLVWWLLRPRTRAAIASGRQAVASDGLRAAVLGLVEKLRNLSGRGYARARSTYNDARPRVQAVAVAIFGRARSSSHTARRIAAITLPLLVLTIFLFGLDLSAIVSLFAPLAGIGLFADYRSRRAQAANPSGRGFSPLRFGVINLPLLLIAALLLIAEDYFNLPGVILAMVAVTALLAFFNAFDAPVEATHGLLKRFSLIRIAPITVPLLILTLIYSAIIITIFLNTSLFNVINAPRQDPIPYIWALLAVLYLDYILLFKSTAINKNDVFGMCLAVCLIIGGFVLSNFDLAKIFSRADPAFVIIILLPLLMIVVGAGSLLISMFLFFLFLIVVASPVVLLFILINAFAFERQRMKYRTTGIYSSMRNFWHWLVAIPLPPALPDDSKGARFATPAEISAIIANRPAD